MKERLGDDTYMQEMNIQSRSFLHLAESSDEISLSLYVNSVHKEVHDRDFIVEHRRMHCFFISDVEDQRVRRSGILFEGIGLFFRSDKCKELFVGWEGRAHPSSKQGSSEIA